MAILIYFVVFITFCFAIEPMFDWTRMLYKSILIKYIELHILIAKSEPSDSLKTLEAQLIMICMILMIFALVLAVFVICGNSLSNNETIYIALLGLALSISSSIGILFLFAHSWNQVKACLNYWENYQKDFIYKKDI